MTPIICVESQNEFTTIQCIFSIRQIYGVLIVFCGDRGYIQQISLGLFQVYPNHLLLFFPAHIGCCFPAKNMEVSLSRAMSQRVNDDCKICFGKRAIEKCLLTSHRHLVLVSQKFPNFEMKWTMDNHSVVLPTRASINI